MSMGVAITLSVGGVILFSLTNKSESLLLILLSAAIALLGLWNVNSFLVSFVTSSGIDPRVALFGFTAEIASLLMLMNATEAMRAHVIRRRALKRGKEVNV